jgi:exosortase H (IPTLxxWG-CTERM-specific)
MVRFLAIFLSVLLVLFLAELTPPVQSWVVMPWTALLASGSAFLVHLFDAQVLAHGNVLQHTASGSGVAIEAGCNGVEACIMLAAAMLAYPAGARCKLAGLLLGSLAIQGLNLLRIISLFYLLEWSTAAFEFAHLYLWQALIMLDVVVVWLVWLRWATRTQVQCAAGVPA